jgi:hypothetical protein
MTDQLNLFEEPPAYKVPAPEKAVKGEPPPHKVPEFVRRAEEARAAKASARGLVAKWSRSGRGYVSIHDPTSGEWHDVPVGAAPSWAKWEAGARKRLYRAGHRDAYDLTGAEMEELWAAEHAPEPDFVREDHPLEEEP